MCDGNVNDGGAAFPLASEMTMPGGDEVVVLEGGMSLRAWFAGQALDALLSGIQSSDEACAGVMEACRAHDLTEYQYVALESCRYADALIAELEKGGA